MIFLQAALASAEGMSWLGQMFLHETISTVDSRPFVTKTAGQLLFDGYQDLLMDMADMFASSERPMDKFAWFYKVILVTLSLSSIR